MSKALRDVKNFFFDTSVSGAQTSLRKNPAGPDARKNMTYVISPVQFARIRHDISMWRQAVMEAENGYYPFRVRMQRLFQDTILNEQVSACWEFRKNMTLLRNFKIGPEEGEADDQVTKLLKQTWFQNFVSYSLDALGFGYSLISLGDIVDDKFPDLSIVRRQNISPDRRNVTTFPNTVQGKSFDDPEYRPYHIWVPTVSELGVSPCGYGLFYKIAKAEIYIRNSAASNADFQEVFGQPIRKGKTQKTEEAERMEFANQIAAMGSQAWILLDEGSDDVELLESKQIGAAYKSFGDFEKRNEQKISKVLLGHADAIDSIPGKLGAAQGGDDSAVGQALNSIQIKDGAFIENLVNEELLPRMRDFGFNIPITYRFTYLNDGEEEEFRERRDKSNLATAQVALTMKNAGLVMDPKYFEEVTGIPTVEAPEPVVQPIDPQQQQDGQQQKANPSKKLTAKIKNRLEKLYSH